MPALAEHYGLAASGSGADGSDSAALRALRARLRALAVEERNLSRIERNVLNVELRKLLKRMSRWGHERVYDAIGRAREILRRAPRG
jgi:hypothetical protein